MIPTIIVGSKNPCKVQSVEEVMADYDDLSSCKVAGKAVKSGVSEQPVTLEETIQGAKNRALNAFEDGMLSVGLEDGLMKLPGTDEYMNVNICAIYDGLEYSLGMSSGFTLPKMCVDLILHRGRDLSEAMKETDMTDDDDIGLSEGAIGLLTDMRITRKEYCKQSIRTALIPLTKPDYFLSYAFGK